MSMRLTAMRLLLFLVPGLLWVSGAAYAQDTLELPEYTLPETGTVTASTFRFILAFLVVVAALYGFFYLMKKLSGQGNRAASSRYMTLLDTFTVRNNCTLYLVRAGERVILIGQSGNAMREIAEFAADELIELERKEPFTSYLDSWFKRKKER
ncbi:MAG TPA: flagellar biosynthetic protein FliO [Atribacteraceae bacterium]|nr:flagellar biosynthetic protein FliO [Atribacteraceae bacterium]